MIDQGLKKTWFVDFYPSFGITSGERCDLLFYGQALNGWSEGFDVDKKIHSRKIEQSIIASNRYFKKNNHTPLDWVNVRWTNSIFDSITKDPDAKEFYSNGTRYRTFRSFFWNVVYKLTSDFHGFNRESWDWSKKVVWSNLYKIAEDGKNPTPFQKETQIHFTAELIKREIEELNPKYCIVLSNYHWWDAFHHYLKTKSESFNRSLSSIEGVERFKETKIIITSRPRLGNSNNHVSQILQLLN